MEKQFYIKDFQKLFLLSVNTQPRYRSDLWFFVFTEVREMFRFLLSLSLFLFFISCVFALNATSTDDTSAKSLEDILELTDVGESRRRRRNRFPFGHHIWCKLMKANTFAWCIKSVTRTERQRVCVWFIQFRLLSNARSTVEF